MTDVTQSTSKIGAELVIDRRLRSYFVSREARNKKARFRTSLEMTSVFNLQEMTCVT